MAAITMYKTAWCGYCRNLARQLDQAGLDYETVDIESDPDAAAFVENANGGNQTVPTLRITPAGGGDDVVLTNPTLAQVKEAAG